MQTYSTVYCTVVLYCTVLYCTVQYCTGTQTTNHTPEAINLFHMLHYAIQKPSPDNNSMPHACNSSLMLKWGWWHYLISCSTATGKWAELVMQGPSPPPRTLYSSCLSRSGTSPLFVFGGGAAASTPVDDRNVYTLDQGRGVVYGWGAKGLKRKGGGGFLSSCS